MDAEPAVHPNKQLGPGHRSKGKASTLETTGLREQPGVPDAPTRSGSLKAARATQNSYLESAAMAACMCSLDITTGQSPEKATASLDLVWAFVRLSVHTGTCSNSI